MKKFKKLIKNPGIFFRDYFNKKYPIINNEQLLIEDHESLLIENDLKLISLEANLKKVVQPIDVVFTWVDNKDPDWQYKYQTTINPHTQKGLYSDDSARFTDHSELYYSVHSVQKFMPWVRNIYIVTDAQIPSWLKNNSHKNVHIIDHSEIIEPQYLPTFNSHVIEAHLHKIPGLSENFIYFNDDVFVARPLKTEHFFRPNGIASIFVADKRLNTMRQKGFITPTLQASFNSIKLLQQHYATQINMPLVHTYVPLKKSIYQLAWQRHKKEIKSFLHNKLRTESDLNMATFLVPWLTYLEGKSVFTREICYYFNIRSPHAPIQYSKLLSNQQTQRQPHSFCANDFNSQTSITDYQDKLLKALASYYHI